MATISSWQSPGQTYGRLTITHSRPHRVDLCQASDTNPPRQPSPTATKPPKGDKQIRSVLALSAARHTLYMKSGWLSHLDFTFVDTVNLFKTFSVYAFCWNLNFVIFPNAKSQPLTARGSNKIKKLHWKSWEVAETRFQFTPTRGFAHICVKKSKHSAAKYYDITRVPPSENVSCYLHAN